MKSVNLSNNNIMGGGCAAAIAVTIGTAAATLLFPPIGMVGLYSAAIFTAATCIEEGTHS